MWSQDNRIKYIVAAVVFVLGMVIILYTNKPKDYDEGVSVGGGVELIGDDVEEIRDTGALPVEEEDEGRLESSIAAVRMRVTDVRENGPKMYVEVEVGIGEDKQESSISVESNTVIYDFRLERQVGPYAIVEGADIVYYGEIDYNAGNTLAEAVVMGAEGESIRFGRIGEVYRDKSTGSYLVEIQGTGDMIRLTEDAEYKNVTTDKESPGLKMLAPNTRVFYDSSNIDSEIDGGLIYKVDTVYVVAQERDEDSKREEGR